MAEALVAFCPRCKGNFPAEEEVCSRCKRTDVLEPCIPELRKAKKLIMQVLERFTDGFFWDLKDLHGFRRMELVEAFLKARMAAELLEETASTFRREVG